MTDMRSWICIISLSAFIVVSCDTASTIDPPNDAFFLKYFGNDGNQEGVDFVQNTDGSLTLFGNTGTAPNRQLYLVNVDATGNLVWEITYGDAQDDNAKDIELTNDGRLVIVSDYGTAPNRDIKIMTLTLDGNKIDSTLTQLKTLAGVDTDEIATSITQGSDGFLVAGSTNNLDLKPIGSGTSTDVRDALHLRYFSDLTEYPIWRKAHGPGNFDESAKIIEISPTQFYFFGYSDRPDGTGSNDLNFYLLGLGEFGETNTDEYFLANPGSDEILSSVTIAPPVSGDGFLLGGITRNAGSADIYLVKLRNSLSFTNDDLLVNKNLGTNLGSVGSTRTASYPSISSGFLVLSNTIDASGSQSFYLDKIDALGNRVWQNPFIYGGALEDTVGSVQELPDGSIVIIGTFAVGDDGEKKMTLIKVNGQGKFLK